jgi:flagellar hook-associated protein 2
MATLTASGIGSGLDISSIVSQLMAVERQPLARLQQKEADVQAQISAMGALKGALSTFQSSLAALKTSDTFNATKLTSSDADVLTLTGDADAVPGSFAVNVVRLAQAHRMGSGGFAPAQTFGGNAGDSVTVTVDGESLTVDLSTAKTLAQIQEAINAAAGDVGLRATLINADAATQHLVLASDQTGHANRIQLSFGGTITEATLGFATLNKDGTGAVLADLAQLDASVQLDGFAITRPTNTLSDVVDGLTLELTGTGATTVTVKQDDAAISKALQGFVDAYNGLRKALGDLDKGALNGNSIIRSVDARVRGLVNQSFAGLGDYTRLAQIGIETNREGVMSLKSTLLTAAIAGDRNGLAALFSDEDGGFAKSLDTVLDGFLKSGGIVQSRVDGLSSTVEDLQDAQARMEIRLEKTQQRLQAQFTALDSLVGQLNNTSTYLAQQLAQLPKYTLSNNR